MPDLEKYLAGLDQQHHFSLTAETGKFRAGHLLLQGMLKNGCYHSQQQCA